MNDGIQALTEKEKETLRLIVRGHDAKSAARELDLSVHTINERLRTARRKLDVTSSREAARMLFESEAATPENLAYESLGDASVAAPADQSRGGHFGPYLIGGLIVMSLVLAALFFASSAPLQEGAMYDVEQPEPIAAEDTTLEQAAREWLTLVDASDWQASFDAAGSAFQEPNTVANWQTASELARVPLGKVVARNAIGFEDVNAPPGGYKIVRFQTDFENRSGLTESVTLQFEDGQWKAVGYFIS